MNERYNDPRREAEEAEQRLFGEPIHQKSDHDILITVAEAQRWMFRGVKSINDHLDKLNGSMVDHENRLTASETKWKAFCAIAVGLIAVAGAVPAIMWAAGAI